MRLIVPALIAALLVSVPAAAQDFLGDFEDFVEDLLPDRPAQRPSTVVGAPTPPSAPSVERLVPPTTPTPAGQRPATEDDIGGDEPPLPRPRPNAQPGPALTDDAAVAAESPLDGEVDPEPAAVPDPDRIYQTACPALLSGVVVGEMLEPIAEGLCGESSPLSITTVRVKGREIRLSSPVTTNCQMAGALADWVGEVDAYAGAALDSPIARLDTGTSMMCRNRVGAEDGFVSEHGFANALDVVGFTLVDGRTIAVEADWMPATAPAGKLLRQAHGAACARFTTVLGPEANAEHEDHLHLDLGCHGQSCTAQICE